FVNCFPENPQGYALFREVAHLATEIDWRIYGSYGQLPRDEYATEDVARCAALAGRRHVVRHHRTLGRRHPAGGPLTGPRDTGSDGRCNGRPLPRGRRLR